ncbi:glycosyltransferase [Hydrogenophaga atypica]|uniref:Glycosyltransferase n=1 Tax=Hydrogenophaga atypica TaxID=249409 RepID=A0ABW2QFQ1_9BURK
MSKPLVSVVIPAYKHEAYIAQAIDSVLSSSVDLELLVRDDASPDGTWRVIDSYQDERLHKSRNETNLGAHTTLNALLDQARGEYLTILNSDDRFLPGRLEQCVALVRDGGVDLVGTDVRLIDAGGEVVTDHWWVDAFGALKQVWHDTQDWAATLLAGNVFMTTSNFFFSRELWSKVRPYSDHRYVHDYDFLLRAVAGGARLRWVDEPLLDYRLHGSNTIRENPLNANLEASSLLREMLPALLQLPGDLSARVKHLNNQWGRIEKYEVEILKDVHLQEKTALMQTLERISGEGKVLFEKNQTLLQELTSQQALQALLASREQALASVQDKLASHQRSQQLRDVELHRLRSTSLLGRLKQVARRVRASAGTVRTLWRVARQGRSHATPLRVATFSALRKVVAERGDQVRVLSFDVFDTLLARCVEPPDLLIRRTAQLLAQRLDMPGQAMELLAQRELVERELREVARVGGDDHECHHDEIIERWVRRVCPSRSTQAQNELIEFVQAAELDLERKALSAKPNARLFLEWARAKGLRIIAISDMYLAQRQVAQLLDELGYRGLIDEVYVSSEKRLAKYSGRLFEHVLRDEGLTPESVMHVGDNFHSDGLSPCRLGVQGVFLDEKHERVRRRRQTVSSRMAAHGGIWPGRALAEIVGERLRLDDRAKKEDVYFQYGLEVLGPVFSTFTQGLLERVQRDRPDRVYFLARDGYLFMKLYEAVAGAHPEALPPAHYTYVSRHVAARAAVSGGLTHDQALIALYNPKQQGLTSVLKTYGLPVAEFEAMAKTHGLLDMAEPIADWHDARLKAFLADPDVKGRIAEHGRTAQEVLRTYFEQAGFFSGQRVAVVDIGWNATIQHYLEQSFATDGAYPDVVGYYFAYMHNLHQRPLKHGSIEGLMQDRRRHNPQERAPSDFEELFEQGARALHATTVGYQSTNGTIEPVLKSDDAPDRQAEIRCNPAIEAMQQGVLLHFEHFMAAQKLTGFSFDELKPYAMGLMERAVVYPTPDEVDAITRLAHTEDFGHSHVLDLSAGNVGWMDFLSIGRLRGKLLKLPWRYAPFARFRSQLPAALARLESLRVAKNRGY